MIHEEDLAEPLHTKKLATPRELPHLDSDWKETATVEGNL